MKIEASVRRIFHQSSMHLDGVQQALGGATGTLGERVKSLRQLIERDRTEQWLHVHVHADRAMTQWELLHLYCQLDEHPERVEELAAGVKERAVERFSVLRGSANTMAELLGEDHDERWYDAVRLISKKRLDDLLVELAQMLYSYQQGVTEVGAGNALAMGETDMLCEGLSVLAELPETSESSRLDGVAEVLKDAAGGAIKLSRVRRQDRRSTD